MCFVSLLTLFYFVSFDTRNILFNSQGASGHSRSTIHIPFQIINVLETTSTSESSASPSPQHRRRYKVTAVAARPKPHVPINRIMGGIVLGVFGTRHNGKYFGHCLYCCSKCKGTTFLKLTRVHEGNIPIIPLEQKIIKCPYCSGAGQNNMHISD